MARFKLFKRAGKEDNGKSRKPKWLSEYSTKEIFQRGAIIFIVILFAVTSLGIGVVGFWQATHPPEDTAQDSSSPTDGCVAGTPAKASTLPKPEIYKPEGNVTELQKTDLKEGAGDPIKRGDCLVMKYYGTLASNGKMFDQNFDTDDGFKFQLGTGQVIQGWDQGLIGMKAGGTRRLVIPSKLAYDSQEQGSIPANSDLVFVVYLDSVQ